MKQNRHLASVQDLNTQIELQKKTKLYFDEINFIPILTEFFPLSTEAYLLDWKFQVYSENSAISVRDHDVEKKVKASFFYTLGQHIEELRRYLERPSSLSAVGSFAGLGNSASALINSTSILGNTKKLDEEKFRKVNHFLSKFLDEFFLSLYVNKIEKSRIQIELLVKTAKKDLDHFIGGKIGLVIQVGDLKWDPSLLPVPEFFLNSIQGYLVFKKFSYKEREKISKTICPTEVLLLDENQKEIPVTKDFYLFFNLSSSSQWLAKRELTIGQWREGLDPLFENKPSTCHEEDWD